MPREGRRGQPPPYLRSEGSRAGRVKLRRICTTLVPDPMSDDLTYRTPDTPPEPVGAPPPGNRTRLVVLVAIGVALVAGLGLLGHRMLQRLDAVDEHLAGLSARADDAAALSEHALERAVEAEASARAAAEGRLLAEAESAEAREDAAAARDETDAARHAANTALHAAAEARAEAERLRKEAEAELNRLEQALGQVAETRRTALGLVMNLGSDYLKFEFDKAELRSGDRELLSRIAGILLTSKDYTVSVNGHTDDVGDAEYNQKLSERRSIAVADWLVDNGLDHNRLLSVAFGEARPIATNDSAVGRQENRRTSFHVAEVGGRRFKGQDPTSGGLVLTVLSKEERDALKNVGEVPTYDPPPAKPIRDVFEPEKKKVFKGLLDVDVKADETEDAAPPEGGDQPAEDDKKGDAPEGAKTKL